jgi:hypothetical protein
MDRPTADTTATIPDEDVSLLIAPPGTLLVSIELSKARLFWAHALLRRAIGGFACCRADVA